MGDNGDFAGLRWLQRRLVHIGTQAASSLLASDGQARIVPNAFMSVAPLVLGWQPSQGESRHGRHIGWRLT